MQNLTEKILEKWPYVFAYGVLCGSALGAVSVVFTFKIVGAI